LIEKPEKGHGKELPEYIKKVGRASVSSREEVTTGAIITKAERHLLIRLLQKLRMGALLYLEVGSRSHE